MVRCFVPLLLVVGACGRFRFDEVSSDAADDAVAIDAAAGFTAPVAIPGPVNMSTDDAAPSITADGLTLYFGNPRVGGFTIWVTTRTATDQPFGPPARVVEVDGAGIEYDAEISSDALELIYNGNMPSQVRRVTRATPTAAWGTPEVVPLTGNRQGAALTAGDLRMLVGVAPDGGVEEYVRATRLDPWMLLRAHASLGGMFTPTLSTDGLELFATDGAAQLFRATRGTVDDEFGPATRIVFGVPAIDSLPLRDPELAADGRTLYFVVDVSGNREIYLATRN